MNRDQIYISAITDPNGEVNVGYLVLFRSGRAAIVAIFMLVIGSYIDRLFGSTTTTITPTGTVTVTAHEFKVGPLGVAIGAIIGAYGLLLAGIAGFLWGDSRGTPQSSSTVTRTDVKVGPTAGTLAGTYPPIAGSTILAGAPQDGELRSAEFLAPKIGKEDVGKSVALVKPKRRK